MIHVEGASCSLTTSLILVLKYNYAVTGMGREGTWDKLREPSTRSGRERLGEIPRKLWDD